MEYGIDQENITIRIRIQDKNENMEWNKDTNVD